MILQGGMESGLRKVGERVEEANLYHIQGGKRPVITQVASVLPPLLLLTKVPLAWSSMNHGDTFVLDSGKKIFVWCGRKCSGQEKMAAGFLSMRLRDHADESIVHVADGEEEEEVDEEWTEHLPLLGRGQVKDQDVTADAEVSTEVSIYRWDKD